MKVDINFAGMPILYKTLKKKKEIQLNFPGKTLRDLTNALIRQFGMPMKKALLDRAGDIDMEIRVILNQADYTYGGPYGKNPERGGFHCCYGGILSLVSRSQDGCRNQQNKE